ncbi:MAG: hypothetical protein CV045_01705 [Cyanobacteria bacterium M5B4]|nr:MAG: hypothetical protein CV045_01705 [Cyanobacteria bacterium M5B4]
MKAIAIALVGLTIGFASSAECLLQISGRSSVALRSVPDSNGTVLTQLAPKTIVRGIKTQSQGKENWLQINQPAIGWLPLKAITTFCGETSTDQTANVNSLKMRGMAGDTKAVEQLVYFLYKGAKDELKTTTIEALEAIVVANGVAVVNVLDNQVEAIRRDVLKDLKKSAKAKEKMTETLAQYRPDTPTVKTWQSIK